MNHFAREEWHGLPGDVLSGRPLPCVHGGTLSTRVLVQQGPTPGHLLLPLSTA